MARNRSRPGPSSDPLEALRQVLPGSWPIARRHLVAVSGGCDSVVLLHLLHALGYRRLVVCHLDHQLRGRESSADAAFVRRLAARLGYICEIGRRDVRSLAVERGSSVEAAGRAARHAFLAEVSVRLRCPRVFLAHHADDQVETVLINLFRGAGPAGLGGMKPESHIAWDPTDLGAGGSPSPPANRRRRRPVQLVLIRPLLDIRRSELEAYAVTHRIRYRDDASNRDPAFLRNRVRHELIPALNRIFDRDVRTSVQRFAAIAQEDDESLRTMADALWAKVGRPGPSASASGASSPPATMLAVRELRVLSPALQRRLILTWLRTHEVSDIGFDLIESIRRMLGPTGPARTNLPRDRFVRRRAGRLFIE